MKKTVFIILSIAVIALLQATVSAEYIVKIRPDVRLMSVDETELTPLIPKLDLYTVEDINAVDPGLVEFAEEDAAVELLDSYDYSVYTKQDTYAIGGIQGMWDIGVYGGNVRVGVIDSGCNPHEALLGNLQEGANFVENAPTMSDNIGHGTSVCGMIAARYGFGNVIGLAHKAEIVPLKFIDKDENGKTIGGSVSRLASAIVSAVDDFGCGIINMSCGTVDSYALKAAIDYAGSKDVIMVAAAGNSGDAQYNYPAAYENVIGVGSVGGSKNLSYYSNINDSVFVTAPGENVRIITGTGGYSKGSGTSFSTPYVSAIAALIREIDPELTAREVMNIIAATAEDLGDEGYDESFGYGLIRADNIAEYMLGSRDYFVSGIDLCQEDNFYEVRFRIGDGAKMPLCFFAGYNDGVLNGATMDKQYINDNTFMLRLPEINSGVFRYFMWDSFRDMKPIGF